MEKRKTFLDRLADQYDIDAIYAFGSRAKEVLRWINGEVKDFPRSHSDVDVGLKPYGDRTYDVREKATLAGRFEEFLNVGRVDLVVIPEADPFVAANIIRGERLFCMDSHRADEYDLYILRRSGDLAPLEREHLSLIYGGKMYTFITKLLRKSCIIFADAIWVMMGASGC